MITIIIVWPLLKYSFIDKQLIKLSLICIFISISITISTDMNEGLHINGITLGANWDAESALQKDISIGFDGEFKYKVL